MGLFSGKQKLKQGRHDTLQEMSNLFIGLTARAKRKGKERTAQAFTLAFLVVSDMLKYDELSSDEIEAHIERILNDYAFSIVGPEATTPRYSMVEQEACSGMYALPSDGTHLCDVEDHSTEVIVSNKKVKGNVRD